MLIKQLLPLNRAVLTPLQRPPLAILMPVVEFPGSGREPAAGPDPEGSCSVVAAALVCRQFRSCVPPPSPKLVQREVSHELQSLWHADLEEGRRTASALGQLVIESVRA